MKDYLTTNMEIRKDRFNANADMICVLEMANDAACGFNDGVSGNESGIWSGNGSRSLNGIEI